jgi:hypothetical protein
MPVFHEEFASEAIELGWTTLATKVIILGLFFSSLILLSFKITLVRTIEF